jgi:hypothetical protein
MAVTDIQPVLRKALKTPERNRYFHGKLLDAHHFQLETAYFRDMRHLLNLFVSGYGVVCGLNVQPGADSRHIVVTSGLAIDKWGREIIVPEKTGPIEIPAHLLPDPVVGAPPEPAPERSRRRDRDEDDSPVIRVLLCYHECEGDPTPVMSGDCDCSDECVPGSIFERFRIVFKEGPAPPIRLHCRIPDLFFNDRLDYEALAKHVSEGCPGLAADPCIPLANIRLSRHDPGHDCDPDRIDITVRPIVYTNDLLLEIILSLLEEERDQDHRHAK